MKNVILKRLVYNDFRGQSRDISFNVSGTTVISGRNGSGKSSVLNAFLWLLTSFDVMDRANYNLFDENSEEEGKTCDVTGYFDIDGEELTLSRKASQTWTKSRDNGEKYRNGDSYEYFVNGLSSSAKNYTSVVEEKFGKVGNLKIMLNTDYYMLLDTKTLRAYFSAMVGEVKDSDFKGDYTDVIDLIKQLGAVSAKKTFSNRAQEHEKSKRKIEAKIEATKDMLPKIEDINDIEAKIASLESQRDIIESRRNALAVNDSEFVQRRKAQEDAIFAKKREMEEARNAYESERERKIRNAYDELEGFKRSNKENAKRKKFITEQIEELEERIKNAEDLVQSLRNEYKDTTRRMFKNVCPECGGEYSGANYINAINRFNDKKNSDLEYLKMQGIAESKKKNDMTEKLESLKTELSGIENIDIAQKELELLELRKTLMPFDATPYEAELARMESERIEIPENEELKSILMQLGDINSNISSLNRELGIKEVYERGLGNIERMKFDVKIEDFEANDNIRKKELVESYQREYADIIRRIVNLKFKRVVVEMTRMNKSGQLDDVCNLSIDGVSNTCNSASKKIIGCEVCEAFQQHYGVSLPLFIDGAESINDFNLPDHDGQRIVLKVSDSDFSIDFK